MTDIAVRPKPLSHNTENAHVNTSIPNTSSTTLVPISFENPAITPKDQSVPLSANNTTKTQKITKIKHSDSPVGGGDDNASRNAVADAMTSLSTPAPTPIAPNPAQPIPIAPAPVKTTAAAPAVTGMYYPYQGAVPAAAPSASPGGANGVPPTPLGPGQPLRGEYRDASLLLDPPPDARRNRGGVTEPFPEKLHRMLSDVERDALTDVVSFFSHGRAFAIHKPRRFVQEIMPHYFRQTRLTSFQRQLNLYGFQRISQGPDNGGYYHELFLRGRPGLCVNMKRTKVKGTTKSKRDPDTEPNFYAMPMPVSAGMLPFPPNYQAPTPAPTPSATSTPAPAAPAPAAPTAFYPSPYANTPAGTTPIFPYPPCPPLPFSAAQQGGQANTPAGYVYPHQMYVMPQTFPPWITAAAGTGVSPMVAAQQPNAAGAVTAAAAAPVNPNQPSPMAVAQQNAPVLIASGGNGYTGASERGATPMMAAQAGDSKDDDVKEEETTPV